MSNGTASIKAGDVIHLKSTCALKPHCPTAQVYNRQFVRCHGLHACAIIVGTTRYAQHLYESGWPNEEEIDDDR